MWKIVVAFIAFAALALFILTKSGGNIDLGGESHGIASHEPAASTAASEAASAAVSAAVEAASAPASGASQ
jgi:hypothetical protein